MTICRPTIIQGIAIHLLPSLAIAREVSFRNPRLPAFINRVELRDLRLGDAGLDLTLQRYARSVGVEVTRNVGNVAVRIEV